MDAMFAFNTLILVTTIIYGLALGVSNWFLWCLSLFGGQYNQNNAGRFLDAAFLVSIVYFYTFGYSYIEKIMAN